MSGSAVFLPYAHEFFLLHDGPTTLPPPFELVATIDGVSIHLFQNITSEEVTVSTGNSARPTVLVPPGDTLVATAGGSTNALLVGRFPFAGRRFTNVLLSAVNPPTYPGQAFTAGTAFLALAGVRGDCGGSTPGTIRVGWPVNNVTGWPNTLAEATGVATQPAGDANGNLSAGWFTLLTTDANLPLSGGRAYSGFCGVAALNFIRTTFLVMETEPLDIWGRPIIDAPVTLHLSESLTGVFADPSIDATFFSLVDLPIGARHSLGDQISNQPWYNFTIRDKSVQGGLVSYSGETLLARLDRIRPTESLILVAGQNGVPNPLTLREVLVRFLDYYEVPYDPDVPEFYLRVGDEILVPTVPAFAIQPDAENPESVYALLEPWWGVFRQYTFRADDHDRLKVTPPAWVDTIGARLNLWRRRQDYDRTPTNSTVRVPWTTARRPIVEWVATVDGVAFSGALPAPLEHGAPIGEFSIGPINIRIQWRTSDNTVQASVWPPPPIDRTIGSLYQITLVLRPESLPGDEVLELTLADLDPADVVSSSADTVINQVVIPHRERTFLPNQQLMQAGALVLRSPVQTAAGAFGANFEFGPMAEELETPNDFLELANEVAQAGTWFWPVDDGVIIQPGGNVTVAYEVEEWAEMWGHNNVFSPQPAEEVNTHSGTVELPANGAEVQLFQFQFPRRTWATSIGGYQAQGRVYGRWRAGESPGIEVRVGNSRFVEFGYLPEFLGIFGQSVYFLWGAIIKLNGTGTTFTSGDLNTYRFGFSRGEDGTWEGGANVPGLSESQALYPNRVYTAPELPYSITPEVGLALARGIVEENLTPKVVRTLTLVPARADGYAAGPWHMGRAVRVPALGVEGRLTSIDWAEAHTAQAQGDTSQLTIDIESTAAPEGSRAAATTYRRAAYGLSHYQQEE